MNQYNVNNMEIDPKLFQHPADKAAADSIRKLPAFQKALEFISKNSVEKEMGIIYRSSLAQLTPMTAPKIFKMLEEAAEMFDVPVIPDVFLVRSYPMMVTLLGIEKPMIMISSQYLENISEHVLWGMIASEMAGIKNGFCEVKFVEWLCTTARGILPNAIVEPLNLMFSTWHKYTEYSFDRAALIATGDFNVTMQMILAGEAPREVLEKMNFADPNCDYMKQSREFFDNEDKEIQFLRNYQSIFGRFSFYASRYLELFKFYQTQYHDLMEDYLD